MDKKIYNEEFHKNRNELTRYTAFKVLKYLNELITINSCVDVGGESVHGH